MFIVIIVISFIVATIVNVFITAADQGCDKCYTEVTNSVFGPPTLFHFCTKCEERHSATWGKIFIILSLFGSVVHYCF